MITSTASRQVTIIRIFDAPRELVFDAWTNPDHLQWWLGPYRSPPQDSSSAGNRTHDRLADQLVEDQQL